MSELETPKIFGYLFLNTNNYSASTIQLPLLFYYSSWRKNTSTRVGIIPNLILVRPDVMQEGKDEGVLDVPEPKEGFQIQIRYRIFVMCTQEKVSEDQVN